MKKIINGKVYDTDTASKLGVWWSSNDVRSFSHCEETLYRKRTGEYFLYGYGGPMTKYARAEGQNSWTGGERIMPMSYDEARTWAEEHLETGEYEAAFGEVTEDESEYALYVKLPMPVADKLRRIASQQGKALRDVLVDLIQRAE